jgi:hypothetical protein
VADKKIIEIKTSDKTDPQSGSRSEGPQPTPLTPRKDWQKPKDLGRFTDKNIEEAIKASNERMKEEAQQQAKDTSSSKKKDGDSGASAQADAKKTQDNINKANQQLSILSQATQNAANTLNNLGSSAGSAASALGGTGGGGGSGGGGGGGGGGGRGFGGPRKGGGGFGAFKGLGGVGANVGRGMGGLAAAGLAAGAGLAAAVGAALTVKKVFNILADQVSQAGEVITNFSGAVAKERAEQTVRQIQDQIRIRKSIWERICKND